VIFEDIHKGRSLIPPHPVPARPTLVRWDLNKPLILENVVVMEFPEAEKHMKAFSDEPQKRPSDVWGDEAEAIVRRNSVEVQRYREWVGL